MNEKPFLHQSDARMRKSNYVTTHYYIGASGLNYLGHCGIRVPKDDPDHAWVRLEVDLLEVVGNKTKRHSERGQVACDTCALRAGIVALRNVTL